MRYGIDLGGTKTEIAALDGAGEVALRRRIETPRGSYETLVKAIADLVREAHAELGPGTVGLGIPGSISPKTGLVRNANTIELNGHPLDRDLEGILGQPVRVANDANCLALSEAGDGAGAGFATVFAVIIGTGCGGAFVVDGKIVGGANGIAGEWGHTPLPWPTPDERRGRTCWCGRRDCLETWISGTALEQDYEAVGPRRLTGQAIESLANRGDRVALSVVERYEDRLARALAVAIDIVDPHAIVLGGGASNLDRLYETLPDLIAPHVFCDDSQTPIFKAKHGDSSGVRGAAWLWPDSDT